MSKVEEMHFTLDRAMFFEIGRVLLQLRGNGNQNVLEFGDAFFHLRFQHGSIESRRLPMY